MTPPAASDATERQTVGDILLARGYISQPQLEQAIASQQQSGKPLGQVLVEAGAITRLELASALAEQWSDTATWLGPPEESGARDGRRRLHANDGHTLEGREAGYAQQLQDAVVELARRVAAFEPTITDLKLRVESAELGGPDKLLDRIEVVQDGVSALARRLDEITDGVERAFAAVETGTGELAGELDDLRGRLDELAAVPATDPALSARVDTLAERLEELRDGMGALPGIDALDVLRAAVEEIAGRPAADPELETRLDERLRELTSRIEALAGTDALDELRAAVTELAARPEADPALAERLEELTGRIEALAGTDALDAVRAAVEEIAGRPGGDPELDSRLEDLATRLDALATRLDETAQTVAERPDAGALAELRAAVAELAGTSEGALVELRQQLAELGSTEEPEPDVDRRVDNIVARLDALQARVEEVAAAASADVVAQAPTPDLVAVLREELESRIDSVATRTDGLARELAEARSQPVEAAPPELPRAREVVEEPQGVEAELERLRMAVERINMHLGERERAIADLMRSRSAELTLEELAARIAELERGGAPAGKGAAPAGDAETSVELRALASRLEEAELSAKADRDKLLTQLERMASSIDWRFRRLESGENDAAA